MTEERETKIPFEDLTRLSFECGFCHSETTIDITNQKHSDLDWEYKTGFACSVCTKRFDSKLRLAILSLIQWYSRAKDAKSNLLCFRIKKSVIETRD